MTPTDQSECRILKQYHVLMNKSKRMPQTLKEVPDLLTFFFFYPTAVKSPFISFQLQRNESNGCFLTQQPVIKSTSRVLLAKPPLLHTLW